MRRRLLRSRPKLRRDPPHRGQGDSVRLRLHQVHPYDHGELRSMMLAFLLTLLHRSHSYVDRRRVRAVMAGVGFYLVCLLLI